jgi:hypothetical protein
VRGGVGAGIAAAVTTRNLQSLQHARNALRTVTQGVIAELDALPVTSDEAGRAPTAVLRAATRLEQ